MAADEDPQSGSPGRPDGSLGPGSLGPGSLGPGSLGPWPDVTVPDDLSALAADVEAYQAEQRAAARRVARARRRAGAHPAYRWLIPADRPIADGFTGPRPRRLLLPLAVTGVALVLCTIVTVLLTLLAPQFDRSVRPAAPLATGVTRPDGSVGGMVPPVALHGVGSQTAASRSLRPAVLLLVPATCDCTAVIEHVATDATAQKLSADVVISSTTAPAEPTDGEQTETTDTYTDPTGTLAKGFGDPTGPTAVVVDSDGIIRRVLQGPSVTRDLATTVQQYFAGR